MEARFFQAMWLGKDTSTNENILGVSGQIVKARTRQTKPDKYNKQMMDVIDSTPMTTPTPTSFVVLPKKTYGQQQASNSHSRDTDTASTGTSSSESKPTHGYTGNHRRSNGNTANVIPPKSTSTGPNNSKTGRSRRHRRRQLSKTAEDNAAADSSTATGSNTRT